MDSHHNNVSLFLCQHTSGGRRKRYTFAFYNSAMWINSVTYNPTVRNAFSTYDGRYW